MSYDYGVSSTLFHTKESRKAVEVVSEHFDDIDVKDRARLYRNILIHVREPRLSRILDALVLPSRREDVKDFVPERMQDS